MDSTLHNPKLLLLVRVMTGSVGPTRHNKNHLDLGRQVVLIANEDGRSDSRGAKKRSSIQKSRHEDPHFLRSALKGLEKGRESRRWTERSILEAIRRFNVRNGRPPGQTELRTKNGLPSYGVIHRTFGGLSNVISRALGQVTDP